MKLDPLELARIARERGFAVDDVERVVVLLELLRAINEQPELTGAFALKGGAAVHLFYGDFTRHSRDIDLNYVEDVPGEEMLRRRAVLEPVLRRVCVRSGIDVEHVSREHASGKWRCRYRGHDGRRRSLEFDISWMARVPLWPPRRSTAVRLGTHGVEAIQVVALEELAAGKLIALLEREPPAARDVFDAAMLLERTDIDLSRVRVGLVLASVAAHETDLRSMDAELPHHAPDTVLADLRKIVVRGSIPPGADGLRWVQSRLEVCRRFLRGMVPLRPDESAFLEAVLDRGEVRPELLDCEADLRERIRRHPALAWRAQNVRDHLRRRDAGAASP